MLVAEVDMCLESRETVVPKEASVASEETVRGEWWGWSSPCSTARWKVLKSVASRAQLYITKAPLFVPFVEMLLFSRSRVI